MVLTDGVELPHVLRPGGFPDDELDLDVQPRADLGGPQERLDEPVTGLDLTHA
ncbi:MAG TPA: hypothetical protein VIY28_03500 [Pseudonocardiaceae bacterium]